MINQPLLTIISRFYWPLFTTINNHYITIINHDHYEPLSLSTINNQTWLFTIYELSSFSFARYPACSTQCGKGLLSGNPIARVGTSRPSGGELVVPTTTWEDIRNSSHWSIIVQDAIATTAAASFPLALVSSVCSAFFRGKQFHQRSRLWPAAGL